MPTEGEKVHPWRWRLLVVWIVVFTIVVAWSIRDGREKSNEINRNRVTSCERTYEGIREVFSPFFKPPELLTAKQRSDQVKFNHVIDRLKARCDVQVNPPSTTTG